MDREIEAEVEELLADVAPGSGEGRARTVEKQLAAFEEKDWEDGQDKLAQLGLLYGVGDLDDIPTPPAILKLSELQMLLLAMHMEGVAHKQICKEIGVTRAQIQRTLNSKPGMILLVQWKASLGMELQALMPRALEVVRETMKSGDKDMALKAVDRFYKLFALSEEAEKPDLTINILGDARTRFLTGLRDMYNEGEVIDVTPETVPE